MAVVSQENLERVLVAAGQIGQMSAEIISFRSELQVVRNQLQECLTDRGRALDGLKDLQTRLVEAQKELAVTTAGHGSLHEDVEKLKETSTAGAGSRGSGKRYTDLKAIRPEKLEKMGDAVAWRDWSHRARAYFGRALDPEVKKILAVVENTKQEILRDGPVGTTLEDFGMKTEWDEELVDMLGGLTTGEPFRIVRSGENTQCTGLEIWRQLAASSDPRTVRSSYGDLKALTSWPRAAGMSNLREYLLKWVDAAQQYDNRAKVKLSEDQYRMGILDLLPRKLHDEISHHLEQYDTFPKLRQRILEIVQERAGQPEGKTLAPVEEVEEEGDDQEAVEVWDKDGHPLMMMMPRAQANKKGYGKGNRKPTRQIAYPNGQRPSNPNLESAGPVVERAIQLAFARPRNMSAEDHSLRARAKAKLKGR